MTIEEQALQLVKDFYEAVHVAPYFRFAKIMGTRDFIEAKTTAALCAEKMHEHILNMPYQDATRAYRMEQGEHYTNLINAIKNL